MRWSTVGGREKKIAVPRCELPSRDSDYSILFGRLEKVRVLHMIQREYLCQVDRLSVGTITRILDCFPPRTFQRKRKRSTQCT